MSVGVFLEALLWQIRNRTLTPSWDGFEAQALRIEGDITGLCTFC